MNIQTEESRLKEARVLIDNIRHGAAVEASSERLLEMIAELVEAEHAAAAPPRAGPAEVYQKALG